jgi:hypothetical protein
MGLTCMCHPCRGYLASSNHFPTASAVGYVVAFLRDYQRHTAQITRTDAKPALLSHPNRCLIRIGPQQMADSCVTPIHGNNRFLATSPVP